MLSEKHVLSNVVINFFHGLKYVPPWKTGYNVAAQIIYKPPNSAWLLFEAEKFIYDLLNKQLNQHEIWNKIFCHSKRI